MSDSEKLQQQRTAGWEVEGFIDRLTRRDDTNSERLVLEAISHLRAFSRDCDALRDDNRELRAWNERMLAALIKLSNEVLGSLPLMEELARREFGNTNYSIMIQRAREARAVIAKAEGTQEP